MKKITADLIFFTSKYTHIRYSFDLCLISVTLIILGVCFIFLPLTASAAINELVPPVITLVSPQKESVIETGRPWIEVRFSDSNSGIDEKTIHLVLDLTDVTDQAIIENTDVTEQAKGSQYRIRYQPVVALNEGNHGAYFYVRDQASNLAELRWTFTVSRSEQGTFGIDGTNTLQRDQYPIALTNDNFDVTALAKVAKGDLRLQLSGHANDYPSGTPNYQYDQYNFFLDKYSARYQYQKSTFITGYAVSPLESELFPSGLEIKGNVFTQKNSFEQAELNWSVFSGEVASSFGLGINVYEMNGLTCQWASRLGWNMGAFYIQLGDNDNYNFIGLQGDTAFGDGFYTNIELVTGNAKDNDDSGSGVTLHLGKSFNIFNIALNYVLLQPDCLIIGDSLSLTSARGGVQRIGVETSSTINSYNNINFDFSLSEDNIDGNYPYTINKGNISFDYSYVPAADFNLDISYLEGFQYNHGESYDPDNESDSMLSFSTKKILNQSTIQTSLSLEKSQLPDYESSLELVDFFSAWTFPVSGYNLTPSLKLITTDQYDDSSSKTAEARLTLDFQTHPDVARSKIALIWNVSDERLSTGEVVHYNYLGLEPAIYLYLFNNSTLSATFNLKYWTRKDSESSDGCDKTLTISWKIKF